MLKNPLLLLFGFILFFESALEGITGNWITTFLKSVSISTEHALYALSCQVAVIGIVRLLLSRIFRHIATRWIMMLSITLILAGALLLVFVSSFPAILLAVSCLGAGFAAVFPVILGTVGELYPELTGTAFSVVIVMALTGNTLFNYLVGLISRIRDISYFPYILIFCVVGLLILYSIANRKMDNKRNLN